MSQVLLFFAELINRFRSRSPRLFLVLQVVGGGLTFLGYLPSMLQRWFNVEVPGNIITMCEDIAKYATGFFVAALLPAKTETVGQTTDGQSVKVIDEKKFPFTANAEKEKIAETVPEPPVIEEIKTNS